MAGVPYEGLKAKQTAIRDALLNGSRCILIENSFAITGDLVFADLDEPTWDGYAPVTLDTWSEIAEDALFAALCVSPTALFTKTEATAAQVYGWAVISADDVILDIDFFPDAPIDVEQDVPIPVTVLDRLRRLG